MTLPDGCIPRSDWNPAPRNHTPGRLSVAARDGVELHHSVGLYGAIITSPDGVAWTDQTTPTTEHLQGVAHDGGQWVVAGDGGTVITADSGSDDSGTVTLNVITLPEICDTIYLLADKTVDIGVTETYEASLDGGTTWEPVAEGESTTLNHSGDQFALRFTHTRPTDGDEESSVWWIVGYGH